MPRRPHNRSTTRRSSRIRWSYDYETFRRRLVEARKQCGLTQVQVAEMLGRSNSYVAKCENGERRVDIVELAQFAKIYRRALGFFAP